MLGIHTSPQKFSVDMQKDAKAETFFCGTMWHLSLR
jgi:hypothetical protein